MIEGCGLVRTIGDGGMVGLGGPVGLFQPWRFYDSMTEELSQRSGRRHPITDINRVLLGNSFIFPNQIWFSGREVMRSKRTQGTPSAERRVFLRVPHEQPQPQLWFRQVQFP